MGTFYFLSSSVFNQSGIFIQSSQSSESQVFCFSSVAFLSTTLGKGFSWSNDFGSFFITGFSFVESLDSHFNQSGISISETGSSSNSSLVNSSNSSFVSNLGSDGSFCISSVKSSLDKVFKEFLGVDFLFFDNFFFSGISTFFISGSLIISISFSSEIFSLLSFSFSIILSLS
jgi:hypothetical protein